ncbi:Gfo/Idh/MocA family oxidoreductase [Mesorhizobium sp. RP14(2022)]|uniref:Gfo/Idh/MocA family oxidoreductase n=1 Tax=Mesorhizobium liriopis TaxID=2953882 RepID=A0ABT1CAA5_9HYPH|nr:Gfo/Idh/MocA family oxidoreductase [Mesorhizobium liriopis]
MSVTRWGIAGFGWVAQDFVAPAMSQAGDELVAVADPSPIARRVAEGMGSNAYDGIEGLAADPSVEAVYVATPNHLHWPVVEVLARNRKAVLCEKPMAATLSDAENMVSSCRAAGVLYATAFDQRHHPIHREMSKLIAEGLIGTVTAVRIAYACWLGADWGQGENWRVDASRAGGGAVMDLAPHGLDLIDALLGEPLVQAYALLQRRVHDYAVDDGGMIVGQTRSGVLASIHNSYNCPEGLPRRRLEVLGAKGQLTAINSMGQEAGGSLVHTDGTSGLETPIMVPSIDRSPFSQMIETFSAALRSGDHRAFDPERDLRTMRLLDSLYRRTS